MSEETSAPTAAMLLATGRRNMAVRDYMAASEVLAKACEALAAEYGESSDECAEAYLWYGKSLLGVSREESGVLGDGVPGSSNPQEDEDDEGDEDVDDADDNADENGKEQNGKSEEAVTNGDTEKMEAESTTSDEVPAASTTNGAEAEPGSSNGAGDADADADEAAVEDTEDDVDNLQLAWEMLDLARSILERRGEAGRALLSEVHLALGEVALESETYDKAVLDMQSCLELQKQLFKSDDRRIAETHYQIGLANSLASNFEDAITHFKNAANIIETRIKTLENPAAVKDDATVISKISTIPQYSVEAEVKELKELLPEIREKIQDMMDYKAETKKRVTEALFSSNGDGPSSSSSSMISSSNGAGASSSSAPKPAASDISHLIKRKRKSSESGEAEGSAPKKVA